MWVIAIWSWLFLLSFLVSGYLRAKELHIRLFHIAPGQNSSSPILFSYCCGNKLLQTQWLKTTRMYSYHSIGQKSDTGLPGLKSRCEQAALLSGGFQENPFSCLFQPLPTVLGSWLPFFVLKASGIGSLCPSFHSHITLLPQPGKVLCF